MAWIDELSRSVIIQQGVGQGRPWLSHDYKVMIDDILHIITETGIGRMRMRSPSYHNVDSYSVTFTDMTLFSDIKVTTVIYQRAN